MSFIIFFRTLKSGVLLVYFCNLCLLIAFKGKKSTGDVTGEQVMKEKEEKDTRIQVYK